MKRAYSASAESFVSLLYSRDHIWRCEANISWATITAIFPQLKGEEQTAVAQIVYASRTSCVATNGVLQSESKQTESEREIKMKSL